MNSHTDATHPLVLLTGATGYIGGRLLSNLRERDNLRLRCLARKPEHLENQIDETVEVVQGDLLEPDTLAPALEGVTTAYYFVHSMGTDKDFEDLDRKAAENFVEAADKAGVERIIYLGGLGEDEKTLSKHLRSRQETGDILRKSNAKVIEFRAAIVIGSGSLSFELIRALVERLPIMICPKWVRVKTQPIAVEDILAFLEEALWIELEESRFFEIGGPDRCSYGEIMQEYARQRGLKRWMIPVPILTPRLSSLWLGLVTPVYARIGRKLVDSLKSPTIVTDQSASETFSVKPRGLQEAIARALVNEDLRFAETRWSDSISSGGNMPTWGGQRFLSRVVDSRTIEVNASPHSAMTPIRQIGGKRGWYYGNWLWELRGFLDLLVGGVGVRRGRRDPEIPYVGDTVDFWRVELYEPDRFLRLRAEMKVPGRAWLEFEVSELESPEGMPRCSIRQTAFFDPVGLFGLCYWYSLYIVHQFVFAGMLRNIGRHAVRVEESR
jgi:uncharacterized protein YbjT (DUF2867 family)